MDCIVNSDREAGQTGPRSEAPPAEVILDQLAQEPEMHRRLGDHGACEFFVARPPRRLTSRRLTRPAAPRRVWLVRAQSRDSK